MSQHTLFSIISISKHLTALLLLIMLLQRVLASATNCASASDEDIIETIESNELPEVNTPSHKLAKSVLSPKSGKTEAQLKKEKSANPTTDQQKLDQIRAENMQAWNNKKKQYEKESEKKQLEYSNNKIKEKEQRRNKRMTEQVKQNNRCKKLLEDSQKPLKENENENEKRMIILEELQKQWKLDGEERRKQNEAPNNSEANSQVVDFSELKAPRTINVTNSDSTAIDEVNINSTFKQRKRRNGFSKCTVQ